MRVSKYDETNDDSEILHLEHVVSLANEELRKRSQEKTIEKASVKKPTAKKGMFVSQSKPERVTVFDPSEIDDIDESTSMSRDQAIRTRGLVARITKSSPTKRMAAIPLEWKQYCIDLEKRFPNFAEPILFIRNQMSLSSRSDNALRISPMLFNGPAGIGKTEFALTLSNDLKTTLKILDVSVMQSASQLSGTERHWSTAQTSLLFDTLIDGRIANPIFMLDEIDKAIGHNDCKPLASLHSLLEKKTSSKFYDLCCPELSVNASNVIWIATSNEIASIDKPIIDRFSVFNIEKPSVEHMMTIVSNQYSKFITEHPAGHVFEKTIRDDVKAELSTYHPRRVRKILNNAFGMASYNEQNYLTVDHIRACDVAVKHKPGIGFTCDHGPAY